MNKLESTQNNRFQKEQVNIFFYKIGLIRMDFFFAAYNVERHVEKLYFISNTLITSPQCAV
jgi:hypothetical protein